MKMKQLIEKYYYCLDYDELNIENNVNFEYSKITIELFNNKLLKSKSVLFQSFYIRIFNFFL